VGCAVVPGRMELQKESQEHPRCRRIKPKYESGKTACGRKQVGRVADNILAVDWATSISERGRNGVRSRGVRRLCVKSGDGNTGI
jgi:hypothetical protein